MRLPPESKNDFDPAPAGSHIAVCVQVIDLGTHMESYQGKPAKPKHKIRIGWELSKELMTDGRPFLVGKTYTFSSDAKSNLRKDLESWRGKPFEETDFGPEGFDVRKLIGVPCLLNVTHDVTPERTYAKVAAIMPLAKGMERPKPAGDAVFFSMDEDAFDRATFDKLGDHWKGKVAASPEYQNWQARGAKPASDRAPPPVDDDDIPF